MLKPAALRSRHRNAPRPPWKVAEAYKQWLRGRPCACNGHWPTCGGQIVAAHVDHGGSKGMGTKTADRNCIPLSNNCHRDQHRIGWRSFEKALPGGDAVKLADAYWRAWPGRAKWEAKIDG